MARYLAATYRIPHVDADPIRRGVGVTWDVLVDDEADGGYPLRSLQKGYREMVGRGASLAALLAATELMDQGFDAVCCGMGELFPGDGPDSWSEEVARLIDPHRLFAVLLVADLETRRGRLGKRPEWAGFGPEIPSGWEHLVVDTTTAGVEEAAETIIAAAQLPGSANHS